MNRLYILLAVLLANISLLTLSSCSDDDNSGGAPEIHCVRTTNPELADSTFTEATVGQMILIEGVNLDGAVHVYINNQDVYFNSNYNTSRHLIVTIPSDLVVRGMDETLPLEIRVETTHGTAVYDFHVIAGYPSLEMYKADLPLNPEGIPEMIPGQKVKLIGKLLHEIKRIYVADLDTVPLYDITGYTLNADRTEIDFTMPLDKEVPAYGIYVVEAYAGNVYCGFSKSPMEPVIYDISSDMPIPGQKVVIYGKYLTNLMGVNLGGEIEIDLDEVAESDDMTELTFTMPDNLPSKDANGLISVTTLGGKADRPFYRYDWIYEDFDGNGTSMMWQWGTNSYWGAENKPADCPVSVSTGGFLYFDSNNNGWWNNINVHGKTVPEAIDASTPLSSIDFRYEVYLQEDASLTSNVTMFNKEVAVPVSDRATGNVLPGKWMSVSVPMTEFGPGFSTWGKLVASDVLDNDNFKVYHATQSGDKMHTAYDNFRFYVKE